MKKLKKIFCLLIALAIITALSISNISADYLPNQQGIYCDDNFCTYFIDEETSSALIINIKYGMKELDIPETVTYNEVKYPVTELFINTTDGYSLFYKCLETINVSKNIEAISFNMEPYSDFDSLKTINIPSGAKLNHLYLPHCPELEKINISTDSLLTFINITGCPKMTKLSIPKTLKHLYIGEDAPKLKLKIAKGNKYLKIKGNQILSKDGKTLYDIIGKKRSVKVCSSVTKIPSVNNKYIKKLTISKNVKFLGEYFLYDNKNISKIYINSTKKAPKIENDNYFSFSGTKKGLKFYVKNMKVAKSLKKQLKGSGVKKAKIYVGKTLVYKNVK